MVGRTRLVWWLSGVCALLGWLPATTWAEVQVAPGLRVEEVVTGVPRPVELALDPSGDLVILSHGWLGDAAGEIYRVPITGTWPVDVSQVPPVVIPFAMGPRQMALGSLAIANPDGDLFLGEENGNRIYRLTGRERFAPFAVGLHHLVGGSSLAVDRQGRLVVLDFVSEDSWGRSEFPPPPIFEWLVAEDYHGPVVVRLDAGPDVPQPRRVDLALPLFPKTGTRRGPGPGVSQLISVAVSAGDELLLLSSLGELLKLTVHGDLQLLARLPAGHYHRTHMAVAPDGAVIVSSGFHVRQLFRVSRDGIVTTLARELGDPGGIAVDGTGQIYIAETALHRVLRLRASD